jgi:long-chain acyl-CoA synthetase
MAVVPLILKNLERGLRERFAALPPIKRRLWNALVRVNRVATRRRPRLQLSRVLLKKVHQAFGGELRALLVGGAFTEPKTLEFFHDLGIQIANGYGCTEACTAITVNDMKPFRPDTLGKPVTGMQVRIINAGADGVGEVAVRSKTVMSHYLDDPELTAETIVDGWLLTGDLGKIDASGHLQLLGRKKNMIVTAEGKNIYPEDIENVFESLPVKEFCVFAANYLWPQRTMTGEQLVLVVHADPTQNVNGAIGGELERRNQRLLPYKRVSGYILWSEDFPRTASLKIKRSILAEQIGRQLDRSAVQPL